jgi:hypothetical protein
MRANFNLGQIALPLRLMVLQRNTGSTRPAPYIVAMDLLPG